MTTKKKIYIESATGKYQKETGDVYVYTKKGKNVDNGLLVANILGMGNWNVILVTKDGKSIGRELIYKSLSEQQEAIRKAKKYLKGDIKW